jgi:hypothetical protein
VVSLSDIFATHDLCMVEGGPFKDLGDNYWMMWGITCFKRFWLNCPLDGCPHDCPFNDIIGILDAQKPKDFPSTTY